MRSLQNYIGGRWVESATFEFLDVLNLTMAQPMARVPLSTAEEVG